MSVAVHLVSAGQDVAAVRRIVGDLMLRLEFLLEIPNTWVCLLTE